MDATVKQAFKLLIDPEWQRVKPEIVPETEFPISVGWSYEISLPFLSTWPPDSCSALYYYVYALGRSLGLAKAVHELKEYYCQWLGFNGVIVEQIRPLHKEFCQWLAC